MVIQAKRGASKRALAADKGRNAHVFLCNDTPDVSAKGMEKALHNQ